MTRQQAQQRVTELNRAVSADADHRWIAHHVKSSDDWDVVRVSAAGMRLPAGGEPDREARGPERPAPVDPRPTITRLIPPVGPPGL